MSKEQCGIYVEAVSPCTFREIACVMEGFLKIAECVNVTEPMILRSIDLCTESVKPRPVNISDCTIYACGKEGDDNQ